MPETSILTNHQKQLLTEFLALAQDREEAFNLTELEGFLFGLAITPDMIMPSEWLPVILGENIPEFENLERGELLIKNLMESYNAYLDVAHKGNLYFPFGNVQTEELSLDIINEMGDWASGFLLALEFCPEIWHLDYDGEYESASKDIQELLFSFAVIYGIVYPEEANRLFKIGDESTDENLTSIQLLLLLPLAVQRFMDYGREQREKLIEAMNKGVFDFNTKKIKIGRNDPCPCGSGKKYKKCCGKN